MIHENFILYIDIPTSSVLWMCILILFIDSNCVEIEHNIGNIYGFME